MRHERRSIISASRLEIDHVPTASRMERVLLTLVCVATLFFTFVTPPFQAPDENQHYMKALLLSEGRVLAEQKGTATGAMLPRAAIDLHDQDFPTRPVGKIQLYDRAQIVSASSADHGRPGTIFAEFPNVANYAPTLYAPGAAGLVVGDAMGLSRLGAFYTGRLFNTLFALAMLAAALRLMPFGRMAMLALALLPTNLYQTGSLSPDAFINGIGFLGLAFALRIGFGSSNAARSGSSLLVAPLLALAKGVYLPLMAAGLRWPDSRRDSRPWIMVGAMMIGAFAFIAWQKYSGGSQALYHIASRKTGEMMMTAPLSDQLAVILADPLAYIRILFASVAERAPVYALQIVGRFGWNAILLPLVAYPLAGLMLASAVATGAGVRFALAQRIWWLAIVIGTALLIETAMYLTATPLGADYVQGTQGRYFLPLLPLTLIALMPDRGLPIAPSVFAASAALLLIIAMATAYDSFWVHGFVTADGMPPHDSLKNALLLPSPRW